MESTTLLIAILAGQLIISAIGWAVAVRVLDLERLPAAHFAAFCLTSLAAAVAATHQTADGRLLIAISNLMLVGALAVMCRGLLMIMRARSIDHALLVTLVWVLLLGALDVIVGVPAAWRGASVALLIAALMTYTIRLVAPLSTREHGVIFTLFACAPLAITALLFAARAVRLLAFDVQAEDALMAADGQANVVMFLAFTALILMFNLSLLYVVIGRLVQRLKALSQRDALTGLFNRRELMGRLAELHAMTLRHGDFYAVVLLDLDHFKHINDRYGHEVGDRALRHLASVASGVLREIDMLARLGGEEFCVLLPRTDRVGAQRVAERLRQAIEASPLRLQVPPAESHVIRLTASLGVAVAHIADERGESVLRRADAAMYRAKQSGRNRVELDVSRLTVPLAAASHTH